VRHPGSLFGGQGMLRSPSKPLDILIWGGVSTPEAAAAFLSTGAAGIVFECVHWLTDLVALMMFNASGSPNSAWIPPIWSAWTCRFLVAFQQGKL